MNQGENRVMEKKRKRITALVLAAFCMLSLSAQQADAITEILASTKLTCGQAAYVAATWLSLGEEPFPFERALDAVLAEGLLKTDKDSSQAITLAELAGLCVRTWEIPGGLFYTLSKSNRYAFKELRARGIILAEEDPAMTVSGFRGLNIMYKCMEISQGNELYTDTATEADGSGSLSGPESFPTESEL